jgi:hypothetical protein
MSCRADGCADGSPPSSTEIQARHRFFRWAVYRATQPDTSERCSIVATATEGTARADSEPDQMSSFAPRVCRAPDPAAMFDRKTHASICIVG